MNVQMVLVVLLQHLHPDHSGRWVLGWVSTCMVVFNPAVSLLQRQLYTAPNIFRSGINVLFSCEGRAAHADHYTGAGSRVEEAVGQEGSLPLSLKSDHQFNVTVYGTFAIFLLLSVG